MGKTWPRLFNATLVVLTLLLGKQLDFVSSCPHARLPASPASVYLLVKLINWFGTRLACAARPKGRVSGVLSWVPGPRCARVQRPFLNQLDRMGTASGRGLSTLARVVSLEGRHILRTDQGCVPP